MRVGGLRVDGIFVASVEDVAVLADLFPELPVPHHLSVSEFSNSICPAERGDEFICFLPDSAKKDDLAIMFFQYFAAHPDILHIIFENSYEKQNALLKASIVLEKYRANDSRSYDTCPW